MSLDILATIILLMGIAVAISVVFSRLKMPAIVGYIIVGILVGPQFLGWVPMVKGTREIAEFGIVFLLFTIGLEFSLSHVLAMPKTILGYGVLQVLFSVIFTTLMGILFHMSVQQAFVVGAIVAMSSTAIVSKQLTDQLQINSAHGINAIGILLIQDLAVIPILILIPSLVSVELGALSVNLLWALAKGLIAVSVIVIMGRYVLRPMFYQIAANAAVELFTLTVLLITLGAAWLTHLLGLSLAFGAFLAGMMLGETEFRHQIEADIRPFRDILLALFFISIGMQFNFKIFVFAWPWLLLLLFALVFFKILLIYLLGLRFNVDKVASMRTGLALAQGGEFGFEILILALNYKIMPSEYGQVILGALLLSMIISSLVIKYNKNIANFILRGAVKKRDAKTRNEVKQLLKYLHGHVIICGYGRVGQNIARIIEQANTPFVAFDLDPKRVADAYAAGDKVFYADATQYEILKAARVQRAKAVVISVRSSLATKKILQQIRHHHKQIPVIVRCYDDIEAEQLYDLGATEVIADTSELSLVLATHLLALLRVPIKKVRQLILHVRKSHYDLLHWVFPQQTGLHLEKSEEMPEGLHTVTLTIKSHAVNKQLKEINLTSLGVRVIRIRRKHQVILEPTHSTILNENDNLVLYGPLSNLEKAEKFILEG